MAVGWISIFSINDLHGCGISCFFTSASSLLQVLIAGVGRPMVSEHGPNHTPYQLWLTQNSPNRKFRLPETFLLVLQSGLYDYLHYLSEESVTEFKNLASLELCWIFHYMYYTYGSKVACNNLFQFTPDASFFSCCMFSLIIVLRVFSPWLVRSTCNGRYPMDDMANRIALEMRRNFQIFFRMKRRMVERGLGKKVHFITAVRQNLICKTEDTLRKFFTNYNHHMQCYLIKCVI